MAGRVRTCPRAAPNASRSSSSRSSSARDDPARAKQEALWRDPPDHVLAYRLRTRRDVRRFLDGLPSARTDDMTPSLFDDGPFAPCPAPFNMAAHTLAAAAATPDKTALEVLAAPGEVAERWSYAALADAVRRTAGGLAAAGLRPGDRLLLRLGNSADFPVLFFAANALGAIPVPVSAQLTPSEVAAILADLEPRLIALGPGLALPDDPGAPGPRPDLAGLREHAPAAFAATAPDDPAYIVYTSGTGGRPKGVVHAQRAAWARRMMWDGWYGLTPDDRVLHAGAFNWTYTLGAGLTDPWAIGATALIYAGPPDRHVWPALAAAHGATIFAAAPGVYRQMLDAPGLAAGFAGLRHGLSAGEALPEPVRAAWTGATGKPIHEALGMSEVSTYISVVARPPRAARRRRLPAARPPRRDPARRRRDAGAARRRRPARGLPPRPRPDARLLAAPRGDRRRLPRPNGS